jgi:hypothetical protein
MTKAMLAKVVLFDCRLVNPPPPPPKATRLKGQQLEMVFCSFALSSGLLYLGSETFLILVENYPRKGLSFMF